MIPFCMHIAKRAADEDSYGLVGESHASFFEQGYLDRAL